MAAQQRPLSPHLQVYKPQMTTILSIAHRATGVLLAVAAFGLAAWLVAVAGSGDAFDRFNAIAGSALGRIVLLGILASLVYHSLNGIRHLLWDVGWGFELPQVHGTGWAVVALTVVITAAVAWAAWPVGGGA